MFGKKLLTAIGIFIITLSLFAQTQKYYILIPNNFVQAVIDSSAKILPKGYALEPRKANNNKYYLPVAVLDTVQHYGYKISRPLLNHLTIVALDDSMFQGEL